MSHTPTDPKSGPPPPGAPTSEATTNEEAREAKAWIRKEVRFAVVMYGGVSLAIYINGVAQELWRMVRATAVKESGRTMLLSDDALSGTETVYRRLGRLLGPDGPQDEAKGPVQTRFVVDVLSGTSAGGINAVYLAKALANNQSLDMLKDLWVKEGDIALLINDHLSTRKHRGARDKIKGLSYQRRPSSLLNSHRMYRELLDAFDEMEKARRSNGDRRSPLVDELDLFVTATDYHGLPLPLKLSDGVVPEMRHRNVFHFSYQSTGRTHDRAAPPQNGDDPAPHNDFVAGNNGVLAFAARCTSSFPFAFEPMRLDDIKAALRAARTDHREWHPASIGEAMDPEGTYDWGRFFADYERASPGGALLNLVRHRPFVDGGYLDNKPFSYALSTLAARSAGPAVDRKLVYIEPNPESPKSTKLADQGGIERPDALANVTSAFTLARYETIREDLQAVLKRNRLIERVQHVIRDNEEDVRHDKRSEQKREERFSYYEAGLAEMIERWGVAYGGYHRLKVAALTDFLARLITSLSGFEAASDEFLAVRQLVRRWREANYSAYLHEGKKTQNAFLVEYDLLYRLRRLRLVLAKIDERISRGTYADYVTLDTLRGNLKTVYDQLQRLQAELETDDTLGAAIRSTKLSSDKLREILQDGRAAGRAMEQLEGHLDRISTRVATLLRDGTNTVMGTFDAAKACQRILRIEEREGSTLEPAGERAGEEEDNGPYGQNDRWEDLPIDSDLVADVRRYYEDFERYDLISYPVLQAAEVGNEADEVDVFRISPNDCQTMRDDGVGKLEGTYLMSFGAFLDGAWRKSDILWGRLDGAERIITALLPHSSDEALRKRLIKDAHDAILEEELTPHGLLTGVDGDGKQPLFENAHAAYQELCLEDKKRPREQTAIDNAEALTRSTRVTGKVLEGISEGETGSWVGRSLAKLGSLLWGLVEVSVPDSFWRILFRHHIKLIYFIGGLLVLAGVLEPVLFRIGLATLLGTLVVDVGSWLLKSAFAGQHGVTKAIIIAVALLVAGLASVGGYQVFVWIERWLQNLVG